MTDVIADDLVMAPVIEFVRPDGKKVPGHVMLLPDDARAVNAGEVHLSCEYIKRGEVCVWIDIGCNIKDKEGGDPDEHILLFMLGKVGTWAENDANHVRFAKQFADELAEFRARCADRPKFSRETA